MRRSHQPQSQVPQMPQLVDPVVVEEGREVFVYDDITFEDSKEADALAEEVRSQHPVRKRPFFSNCYGIYFSFLA